MKKSSTKPQIYLPNKGIHMPANNVQSLEDRELMKALNEKANAMIEAQTRQPGQGQKSLHREISPDSIISADRKRAKKRNYKIDRRESFTSFIEVDEIEEAIAAVEASLGFEIPRTCGQMIDIRLHVDEMKDGKAITEDGEKTSIELPEETLKRYQERERYNAVCGLVIGIGPDAFDNLAGPICRIGDFVSVERMHIKESFYRGYAVCQVRDDKIARVIADPDYVTKS